MAILGGSTGVVFVVVLGSLFVITCLMSSVKAVRDRFRIKKRRQKRKSIINGLTTDTRKTTNDNDRVVVSLPSTSQLQLPTNDIVSIVNSDCHDINDNINSSVYSIDAEVNNITIKSSNTDVKVNDAYRNCNVKTPFNGKFPRRANSYDITFQRNGHIDHFKKDFTLKKIVRSHSYEVATPADSLQKGTQNCVQSVSLLKVYNYSVNFKSDLYSSFKMEIEHVAQDNKIS